MIVGTIDDNLEARISLQVSHDGRTERVEFLVDTGFNGYLAVPPGLVNRLRLQPGAVQRGITADGRLGFFDTVELEVSWHDQPVVLRAQVLDEPLVGTRLLNGNEVLANWIVGGEFRLAENE